MKAKLVFKGKQFAIGEQWQHKDSLECVTILGITSDVHKDCCNVQYLSQEGLRYCVRLSEFMNTFKHIPHMKGAYH